MHGHEYFLRRRNNSAALFSCCYITVNFATAASQNRFSTFTPFWSSSSIISCRDQRQEYTEINKADRFFIVWAWERIEITSCAWAFTRLVYSSKNIFLSSSCWENLLDNNLLNAYCLFAILKSLENIFSVDNYPSENRCDSQQRNYPS